MTDNRFAEIHQKSEFMESPFRIFPNESHTQASAPERTGRGEAAWLLSNGSIGELEKSILKAVSLMNFATIKQIFDYLIHMKQNTVTEIAEVRKRTIWLCQKSFLNRLHFVSENEEQHSLPCFFLGYHGVGCLRAMGIRAFDQPYVNAMETWKIKRMLAANQLMNFMIASPTDQIFPSLLLSSKTVPKVLVKPQYTLSGIHGSYLVEAVRNTTDWRQQLDNKLQRYGKIIKYHQQISALSAEKPLLLISFESYKHIEQFTDSNISPLLEQSRIFCTFDRAIYEHHPQAFVCVDKLLPKRFCWNMLFAR